MKECEDEEGLRHWGCQVIKHFESEEKNLVLDALANGEPMKLGEIMCNVIGELGAVDDSCCRVMYHLEPIKQFFGEPGENGIEGIIQMKGDQGVNQNMCAELRKKQV